MPVSFFVPKVEGYNISSMPDGNYSVKVNNGNIGASVMNKERFDKFIKEEKAKGTVKPSTASEVLKYSAVAAGAFALGDLIFCKGRHVKSILNKLTGTKLTKEQMQTLEKERCSYNVVKRDELAYDELIDTMNKFRSEGHGDLNLIKADNFKELMNQLQLSKNAVIIADNTGKPLKIFDSEMWSKSVDALLNLTEDGFTKIT